MHGCRWLWKPKWKEPALLLAPVSPNSCADDMRMSLTIGEAPLRTQTFLDRLSRAAGLKA